MCRIGGILAVLLLATACTRPAGRDATIFRIAIASDEPRATMAGRHVLTQGGNAADAAVAIAMTMAVTLPSRAGLGGGGACLVHDPETGKVRGLDFLPYSPAERPRGVGLPLMLRGLAVLHAEHGTLRWQSVVVGAETAARFGAPVSRALAADIAATAGPVPAPFIGADGRPLREGDPLKQDSLAGLIGEVRSGGVGVFYNGALARQFADGAAASGLPLDVQAVRSARPVWREPVAVRYGRDVLNFMPPPAADGDGQALFWGFAADQGYEDLSAGGRLAFLSGSIESVESFADIRVDPASLPQGAPWGPIGTTGPGTGATATFVVLSNDGMAVSCGLTVNGRFGTGVEAPGTGVLIAGPAFADGPGLAGLTMLVNEPKSQLIYAGAADSYAALMLPLMEVALRGEPVEAALAAPRVDFADNHGPPFIEQSAGEDAIRELERQGYRYGTVPALGRATAIFCQWDRASSSFCSAASDPRGNGLAFTVEG